MLLAINYPSWIHPQIFPNIPFLGLLRWYGLMYVFAFATAYLVMNKLRKNKKLDTKTIETSEDDLFSFFLTGIVFLLIGARLFSALIYDSSKLYYRKPWLIFWPFDENWNFTGLAGMSYHGGVVGGTLGIVFWCIRHKRPVLQWADAMAVAIPLGYTFGRLGNFLNAELYGRITTMPWGMVFPDAQRFSASIPWVAEFAQKAGLEINSGLVNLPRHPSQLYEAFFEGLFLFGVNYAVSKKKPYPGFLTGLFYAGYGFVRFIIEYFREPDIDLGFRIAKISDTPTYLNVSLLNISTGQILCFIMFVAGLSLIIVQGIRHKKMKSSD